MDLLELSFLASEMEDMFFFSCHGCNVINVDAVSVPDQLQQLRLAINAPFRQHMKFTFDHVADRCES